MRSPVNILLVDDQPAKLLSYRAILDELGENLLVASSAREALEILLKNEVAVVLTDVCMPELDGFELTKMLREHPRYETTAVIFISAVYLSEDDRARAYELGAVDYVSVPIVPAILRAKVKLFVDLYRKTRDLEELNRDLEMRVLDRTGELLETNTRLRESEERMRRASEAAEFGTYDYDVSADRLHCSAYLKTLMGMDRAGEVSLGDFLALVHADDRETVRRALSEPTLDAARLHEVEFRTASQDMPRWVLSRGRSFTAPSAGLEPSILTTGTILDITSRKLLEERQRLLIAELDHRVKNVLANVRAMVKLSGRSAPSVDTFVEALDGRLQSMASAHTLLSKAEWRSADLAQLAAAVLAPFRSIHGDNLEIRGEPVRVPPKTAQGLALVLHELATNAVKHGALSDAGGRVSLSWWVAKGSGDLELTWRESGGPSVRSPERRGLGLTIIDTALADASARIKCDFEITGVVCVIVGPLGRAVRSSDGLEVARSLCCDTVSQPAVSDVGVGPMRILIVEDEPLVSMQLQSDLEDLGHSCLSAASVAAACALVKSRSFDVALLDFNLGGETSSEVADKLAELGIPFALATGYTDDTIMPGRLRERPRLSKPFLAEDLDRVLAQLVAGGPASPAAPHPDKRVCGS